MPSWLSQTARDVLGRPMDWRWATDAPPVHDPPYQAWYADNYNCHSHTEVMIACRGETLYGIDGHLYAVAPGDVMVFPAMVPHQNMYPPWVTDIGHVWISVIMGAATSRLYAIDSSGLAHRDVILTALPDTWLMEFDRALASDAPTAGLRRLSLVADLVARIMESETDQPSGDAHIQSVIQGIMRHLDGTAGRGDTIQSLAKAAAYSPYHFQRLFKDVAGCTVHAYIDTCRVRRTRALIADGIPHKAIAAELGFASPQSFSRWLRHHPDAKT